MKFFITILFLGHIMMAATIDSIDVNGIKVPFIYEQDTRLPLTNTQIVFTNAGSIKNTKIAGLSNFSAKILNEGTKKLGSNGFAEALESKAISLGAHTGTETFILEMGALQEQYANGMDYFEVLLQDPNYSAKSLSKVKTMTLGGLSRKENDFDYVASNALKNILFDGAVLGEPAEGTIQSIESITLDDVKNFVKENLVISKAIVVVGGDIDVETVKKRVAKLLAHLPKGEKDTLKYYDVRKKSKTEIIKKETEQAYIYFGSPYAIAVDDPEFYKARVATYILGTGGFGSRLMEEIRVKRGLAYSAYARVHVAKSNAYMTGYLQTKLDSMDEAKSTVAEVIENFVKKGVTQEELEQTKKFLLGSEPLRVETLSQRLNRTFMEYYKGFELGHSEEELEKIKNLELKDLNEYIKKHTEILDISFAIVTK